MLPCASVSEALCYVNRKQLGFVSAIKGYLKAPTHTVLAAFFTCVSPMHQHLQSLQRAFTGHC